MNDFIQFTQCSKLRHARLGKHEMHANLHENRKTYLITVLSLGTITHQVH